MSEREKFSIFEFLSSNAKKPLQMSRCIVTLHHCRMHNHLCKNPPVLQTSRLKMLQNVLPPLQILHCCKMPAPLSERKHAEEIRS